MVAIYKLEDVVLFLIFLINECMDDKENKKKCILVIICDGTELQQRTIFYVCVLYLTAACILCLFFFLF